uniref:sodium-coupled neutral amino acid transporter 9 isoform X1 n=1 Tax=Ciona intestinalis TaxID=7719 RepID=UPI000180BD85|nr:sodium-coupled neutral amino acid transporter 9 isoform X1 [Ciona intestinalis]|eukprot:XP_002125488.1 sodium-coupled neutral amino acid transporter 9 isoform X1 [Ciona intestinalis]
MSADQNCNQGAADYGSFSCTPTDARLSQSVGTNQEVSLTQDKFLRRSSSRKPLMHPRWYSESLSGSTDQIVDVAIASDDENESLLPKRELNDISITFSRHKYYSKLVDPSDTRMRIPDHVLPSSFFYIIPTKTTGKQSSVVTIFAIWNTMMGTSLLSMPWGLGQAGFLFGILLILLSAMLTLYTAFRVLQSTNTLSFEAFEFSDVVSFYLGRYGEWVAITFSLVTFLGGMIVYWVLMTNFLFTSGIFIFDKAHSSNISMDKNSSEVLCPHNKPTTNNTNIEGVNDMWNISFTVPIYLAVLVFPLLNFKSPTFFTKFNCLGTLSVFFLLALVITKSIKWGWNIEYAEIMEFRITFPALTGMLSLAFFLHNAAITIVKNNQHPENNVRDLSIGYLLTAVTYLSVGILFYASFPLPKSCISSNLLQNLSVSDPFAAGARVFLLFQMITVFPLLAYMFRANALYALFQTAWPGRWHVLLTNFGVLVVCVLIAMFYPHIGDIIRYSGSLCGLVYIFCLPSVVYMLSLKICNKLTLPPLIIHVCIILLGVLNFIAQFIITPSK